ncbi:Ephrin RBD domain-containing protein, partial [Trichostrongylus colubriformis]
VSLEEFQRCSLGNSAELVASCDGEHQVIRYTLVQDDYQPGQLYFITTSSGKKDGLYDRRLGLCNEKNMRMAVLFGTDTLIQRHDPLLGSDVDLQRLMRDRFYLAEENGELNWKKNVLPELDFDWKSYLQNQKRKLKFDKSLQIEPIPLDNEFITRWEQLRNQRHQNELGFFAGTEERLENVGNVMSAGSPVTLTIALLTTITLAFDWIR